MRLLTIENAKTSKGQAMGYLTGILYLAPHRIAYKDVNLCPKSTAGCRASCLYTAGRGAFKSIQESRIIKTIHLIENEVGFIQQLDLDIQSLKQKAKRLGLKPVVRLNGTSDLPWESIAGWLMIKHSDVQFYDYTKIWKRLFNSSRPKNYHLTFSVSENTPQYLIDRLNQLGATYAIVKRGLQSYNGDEHDLRFLNKGPVYLRPKGRAKRDVTGFVQ